MTALYFYFGNEQNFKKIQSKPLSIDYRVFQFRKSPLLKGRRESSEDSRRQLYRRIEGTMHDSNSGGTRRESYPKNDLHQILLTGTVKVHSHSLDLKLRRPE